MKASPAEMVRSFIDDVWHTGNIAYAHPYVNDGYSVDGTTVGVEWVRANVEMFRRAFPDFRVDIETIVEDATGVAALLRLQGTHLGDWKGWPASGNVVDYREAAFWTVANGKLRTGRFVADTLGLRVQLGIVPASAWQAGQG